MQTNLDITHDDETARLRAQLAQTQADLARARDDLARGRADRLANRRQREVALASEHGGLVIYFGGCDNAAAEAVDLLKTYEAVIDGAAPAIIARVDVEAHVLYCAPYDPETGEPRYDRTFARRLSKIRVIEV